ncbi:MAG: ATP-binding protein, partial [Acidobacteriota bacterium]
PAGTYVTRRIAERVAILAPGGGLWRPEGERIVPDTTFQAFLPQGVASIQDLTEDNAGRVWISAGEASGVARPTDSGAEDVAYAWQPTALRRAATRSTDSMFAEPDGPLWLGGPNGLIRFDTRHVLEPAEGFPVSIRRVTTSGGTRLYDGQPRDTAPELPFADNNLRFAFAAPRLDAPERTQYRVRLDGLDDTWSPWSTEQDKDYTTLWEGRYVFRVQARDVYGFLSREDSLAFRILPPWYRSLWAYALYLLAFAAAVAAFVQFYRRKLARERAVSARLREVDRLKDEFLANTSHELRTPLNGITGLAESLIDGATGTLPDETRRNLSMIAHSGRRLSRLVDDILDFSKLRHHSLNLELRRVDLRALADVVLTLSRSLVGDKALELVNAVPADLPAVAADENRLQQILHNLVGNAIKFTDAGTVEVSAEATQGSGHETVEVRVADSGIGIPLEKQARIFDAFEQADASIEREYGGTGLGLAVTRQLVELHGGKIRVTSQPGEGSTFRFTLRVAEEGRVDPVASTPTVRGGVEPELPQTIRPGAAPSAAEAPAAAAEPSSAASAARILAVDDDPVNLQVLRNFLAVEDFDLTLASSGEEALRLVQHHSFDLVLLDVMMPKLSGYEVCRALRQQHPIGELPVVFLTAKSRDADVVSGMALGANDYLTKPVSKDRLLARVRPHLELLEIHRNLEGLVEEKMAQIKVLSGMLPICAGCKKVRDDEGYWNHLELYIKEHSEATFSHGICPECAERFYAKHPELRSEAEIKS